MVIRGTIIAESPSEPIFTQPVVKEYSAMQIRTKAGLLMAMVTLAVTLICANSIINLNRLAGIDREVDIFKPD